MNRAPTQFRFWRLGIPSSKGKPETGGMARVPAFRSQVSAVRYLVRVFGFGCRFRKSAIRPLSSIQSSTQHSNHFGWRVAAPGGRWQD